MISGCWGEDKTKKRKAWLVALGLLKVPVCSRGIRK